MLKHSEKEHYIMPNQKTAQICYAYPTSKIGGKSGGWFFRDEKDQKISPLFETAEKAELWFSSQPLEDRCLLPVPSHYLLSQSFYN